MPLRQIALISQTPQLTFAETAQISAVLQKQVMRDFGPIWNVQATVDAFATEQDKPPEYWPIFIRDDINTNAAGIHSDSNGQPVALVEYNFEMTSLFCSHECLEMLADPRGLEFVAAHSIEPTQGQVNFLLEVCDPCQHADNGYLINNFLVSDFYTPHYFDPVAVPGIRYCFSGNITRPKQILPGGYVSWQLPDLNWWQAKSTGEDLKIISLGKLKRPPLQGWREVIDQRTREPLFNSEISTLITTKERQSNIQNGSRTNDKVHGWSRYLRRDVDKIIAKSKLAFTEH